MLWCAAFVISKAFRLTQFTDKFGICLDKSYRNEKQLSAVRKLVSKDIDMCQMLHYGEVSKVAVKTNQILLT